MEHHLEISSHCTVPRFKNICDRGQNSFSYESLSGRPNEEEIDTMNKQMYNDHRIVKSLLRDQFALGATARRESWVKSNVNTSMYKKLHTGVSKCSCSRITVY